MPYNVDAARQVGLSDEEIATYLASTRNYRLEEAIKAGVQHKDIVDYLAPQKSIETKPIVTAPPKKETPPEIALTPPGLARPEMPREIKEPVAPPSIDLSGFPKELIPSHEPVKPTLGVLPVEPSKDLGLRPDGTPKGTGFLGVLKRPDGKVSSEISIGVNIDGKEVEIPTLVPTLAQDEINYLLSGGKPTDAIVGKAAEHAKSRMVKGLSPFAQAGEQARVPDAERAEQVSLAERAKATAPSIGMLKDVTEPKPIIQRNLLELLGIVPVGRKPIFGEKGLGKEEIIRSQNIVQMANETNLPPSFVEENYDAITQKLGMRGVPTHKEMIQMLISAGIGKGIITAPFRTAMGLATFLGVKELESLTTQIGKGEVPKPLQGRELKEFLGPLDSRQNLIIDAMEFMVPGFLGAQIMLKTKGKLSKKLSDKIIDDAWDTYVEKQSKNLLEYKGKPPGETIQKLGQPLPRGAIPTEKPSMPIGPGPTGFPASEPIGSTIPVPGQSPITAKPSAPIPPPGQIIPPAMQGPPSPAAKAQEIVGTTIPTGTVPIPPSPRPVEAPQLIPGMGVAPLAPPVQPPTEVPSQPIPQMMGMGQEMPLPEVRPSPAEAENLAKITALRENTDRLIREGGYGVAKQQPRSQTGEQALLNRGYKPILWDESTGELQINPLGVWVKEPAQPVEEVISATMEPRIAPEQAQITPPTKPLPTEEVPKEPMQMEGKPIEQAAPPPETVVAPPEALSISEEGLEKPLTPGIPPSEWRKDPILVADAEAVAKRVGVSPDNLNYQGIQEFEDKGMHMWDVTDPSSPKFHSAVYGPVFKLSPEQIEKVPPTETATAPSEAGSAVEGKARSLNTPEGWTTSVQSTWRRTPGWQAEVDWKNKRIVFETEADSKNVDIVNHEIGHIQLEDKLGDVQKLSDSPLLQTYAKIVGEAKDTHVNFIREHLAMDYGEYLTNPEKAKPELKTLFEEYFPKEGIEEIPPTAQHLELMPEEYPNIVAAALKQDGKIYKDHTHAGILIENNLDPEKAIPGFVTKQGKFVEQYPKAEVTPSEKVPEPTQMREKEALLSESSAKKLLSLPYEQRTSPYGDQNAKFRQQILKELTGQDLPKNKAGAGKVREELTKAAGIDTTGKAPVEIDREIHDWLQGIAGVEKKAEIGHIAPTLPPGVLVGTPPAKIIATEPVKGIATTTSLGVPTIRAEKTEGPPVQVVPQILPMGQQAQVGEPPPLVETPVEEPIFSITNEAFKEFDKPFSDFDLNTIPEEMTIKVQAIREETGKPVEIYENAREAIRDHRGKMKQFKSLLDCIKA